ncbi:class I SAM-dependent methyltransferase [Pelagerythrobacter marinus]|uniref:class I SAM-dependent methyltransferase n=1 Tax=Pelagerythrobacter marinus TaxID=538382 RepID=UPI0020368359|nr:class I SAM-dependent methyltransferase [Pelagerythrobacter marinus]USA38529.1 methyltransferase domain-containing protein [Pelagerythrobacter marinus]WPZ07445.1 methyltransferase domain-containing protein [Pelagerythrobacter marinus]
MTSDHVRTNRDYWNSVARHWVEIGERQWNSPPNWGFWGETDESLNLLPADMTGMKAIELGCGTAYVSGWMTRRGARVTAIDISAEQLATARRLAKQHGAEIAFIEASAESVPLEASLFDFAVSEYGAAIWCDPDLWIPEAVRLLRPGGTLAFIGNHPMVWVATPSDGRPCEAHFHRPYRGLNCTDWTYAEFDPGGIEFNRTMEDWLLLFRKTGLLVLDYRELYAPDDAEGVAFSVPAEWARNWPVAQV